MYEYHVIKTKKWGWEGRYLVSPRSANDVWYPHNFLIDRKSINFRKKKNYNRIVRDLVRENKVPSTDVDGGLRIT